MKISEMSSEMRQHRLAVLMGYLTEKRRQRELKKRLAELEWRPKDRQLRIEIAVLACAPGSVYQRPAVASWVCVQCERLSEIPQYDKERGGWCIRCILEANAFARPEDAEELGGDW